MTRQPLESRIVKTIRSHLEARGWLTWKNHGGSHSGNAGIPDVMAVRDGRLLAIEVKRPGGNPTLLQERWLAKLRGKGAVAIVATGWVDVESQLVEQGVEL